MVCSIDRSSLLNQSTLTSEHSDAAASMSGCDREDPNYTTFHCWPSRISRQFMHHSRDSPSHSSKTLRSSPSDDLRPIIWSSVVVLLFWRHRPECRLASSRWRLRCRSPNQFEEFVLEVLFDTCTIETYELCLWRLPSHKSNFASQEPHTWGVYSWTSKPPQMKCSQHCTFAAGSLPTAVSHGGPSCTRTGVRSVPLYLIAFGELFNTLVLRASLLSVERSLCRAPLLVWLVCVSGSERVACRRRCSHWGRLCFLFPTSCTHLPISFLS